MIEFIAWIVFLAFVAVPIAIQEWRMRCLRSWEACAENVERVCDNCGERFTGDTCPMCGNRS